MRLQYWDASIAMQMTMLLLQWSICHTTKFFILANGLEVENENCMIVRIS